MTNGAYKRNRGILFPNHDRVTARRSDAFASDKISRYTNKFDSTFETTSTPFRIRVRGACCECRFAGTTRASAPRAKLVPDLHLLLASEVFAVESRFMAHYVGMPSTRQQHARPDRRRFRRRLLRHSANVKTVNHGLAREGDQAEGTSARVSAGQFRTLQPRCNGSGCSDLVATDGIKWDFTGGRPPAAVDSAALRHGYRDGGRGDLGTRNRLLAPWQREIYERAVRARVAAASERIRVLTIPDRRARCPESALDLA